MKRGVISAFIVLLLTGVGTSHAGSVDIRQLPPGFRRAVESIEFDGLGGAEISARTTVVDRNTVRIVFRFSLPEDIRQDDWQVRIRPKFPPSFNWANHLAPEEGDIIDQHSFRTPAMITQNGDKTLVIIPDVDLVAANQQSRWYMDLDVPANTYTLGLGNSRVSDHVLYTRAPGAGYRKGEMEFGFYLMYFDDRKIAENPFRPVLSFFWNGWGSSELAKLDFSAELFDTYCEHTYRWAFDTWKEAVWQEFEIEGRRVGAPVFIVNVTQSPNYPGEVNEREFRSVWNQAWFSSLRSASGLYRYARMTGNAGLLEKACLTKELALSFPQKQGFFPGLIATEMEWVETDGRKYHRSKGWDRYYWGNSNRNPFTWDPREAPFHILDMSWTALQMLEWYGELDNDPRLAEYATAYADALLKIQEPSGFFPAWLDTGTLAPYDILTESPETSLSALFMLKLYETTGDARYKDSALKALDAVITKIIPEGRWEDFETYWSCCRVGTPDWVGRKVPRNNMYKQCNFSMYWTAQALLEAYSTTGEKKYLRLGERTLDELLMTQASWQPPYIYVDAIGGFGVMNTDGEWNDARQSLFSTLIMEYASVFGREEYRQRGLAALRASFAMMYCEENPKAREQWEKTWPFFGPEDYGFMMENYGHGGTTSPEGVGIGEFTIYDWGNGAASQAYMRMRDMYGDSLFKKQEK